MRMDLSDKRPFLMKPPEKSRQAFKRIPLFLVFGLLFYGIVAQQSLAMTFSSSNGKTTGNLDMTLSYGAMWRVENPNRSARGWTSANEDDGNRNFDAGLVSNLFKVLGEVDIKHDLSGASVGFFGRGYAFRDTEIQDASNDHDSPFTNNNDPIYGGAQSKTNRFNDRVEDILGQDVDFLDAFVYGQFLRSTDHPLTVKVGWHMLNWGESTFITHGISSVMSHVDASKAAQPGTELKEILLPVNQASITFNPFSNLTLGGYYQLDHEENIFPAGNYFSDLDILVEGAENMLIPLVALGPGAPVPGPNEPAYFDLDRGENISADDNGQFGVSLSFFSEALNDTEFAIYYINYHRKLPDLTLRGFGGKANDGYWSIPGLDTSSYALTYFEDVQLFGFSFSTNFPSIGTISGEVAYHKDIPLQTTNLGVGLGMLGEMMMAGVSNPEIPLSTREDLLTAQITLLQTLRIPAIADDITILAEVGMVQTPGKSDGDVFRGFDPCNKMAWGYRAMFEFTYYNGIGKHIDLLTGTDLITTLNFSHDVDGLSAIPAGSFTKHRKSAGIKIEGVWHSTVSASIGYNMFWGGGDAINILGDRDNVTFVLKYRF